MIIVPNHDWGGNGSLGCDVGYGLLHRIPRKLASTRPSEDVSVQYSNAIFSAPAEESPDNHQSAIVPGDEPSSSTAEHVQHSSHPLSPNDEASSSHVAPESSQEDPSSSSNTEQQQLQHESSLSKAEQPSPSSPTKETKPSSPQPMTNNSDTQVEAQ